MKQYTLHKALIYLICQLLVNTTVVGQSESEGNSVPQPVVSSTTPKEIVKHDNLETEIEFYPFNLIVPSDPVVKNEVMFDYHRFHKQDKLLGGIRFFCRCQYTLGEHTRHEGLDLVHRSLLRVQTFSTGYGIRKCDRTRIFEHWPVKVKQVNAMISIYFKMKLRPNHRFFPCCQFNGFTNRTYFIF